MAVQDVGALNKAQQATEGRHHCLPISQAPRSSMPGIVLITDR
jgi:hypothetical protein